jgi:hypothetical protein
MEDALIKDVRLVHSPISVNYIYLVFVYKVSITFTLALGIKCLLDLLWLCV